jgi:phenylacetate-CoA ligase
MRRFLYRSILLPAFEGGIKRRNTFRYWKELERTQWLSREELEQLQFSALHRLVQRAFQNCPYYRDSWTQLGLDAQHLQAPEDFQSWPIIDRHTILANRPAMRAQIPGMHLYSKSTGGSSGEPLHFDFDSDSNDRRMAAWHRGYAWGGAEPGAKALYLWGVPLGPKSLAKRWKDWLYHRLYRRLVLNTFELSEATVPRFLEQLNRYRPEVIVAYSGPLYVFAKALAERQLKPFSPNSIVVGAEKLYRFQRDLIEQVFAAPVFETYGSREFMLIGGECDRHEGLHLTMEHLLVEVLDDDGRPTPAGQEGNLVITDLYNYGMPFVRYSNGDRAVAGWGTCSCGRGLPILKEVIGRRSDMIDTPDGRHLTGLVFPHLIKDFPAVQRFLVIQDEPDHVELRVATTQDWSEADRNRLDRSVRELLGPAMRLDLVRVDDIPPTAAGKHAVVINRVQGRNNILV